MANGDVTVRFGGINLDDCIEQGLEFTGFAKCPHCEQVYSFQIQISKKYQMPTYPATKVDPAYNVFINFSGNAEFSMTDFGGEPRDPEPPCQPCNGCTPNCERRRGR
jgi:hypothetical protein